MEQPITTSLPQKEDTFDVAANGTSKTENASIPGDTNSQHTPNSISVLSSNTGPSGGIGGATAALAAGTSVVDSNGSDGETSEAALIGTSSHALAAADERSDISSIGSGTAGSTGGGR